MRDYDYVFTTMLHEKLKEKVIASVFCRVMPGDELYVKIESSGDLIFTITFENFSNKLLKGWTTDHAVYEIMKKYKSFILGRFFKRNEGPIY